MGTFKGCTPDGVCDMTSNARDWTASDFMTYPGGQWQQARRCGKVLCGGKKKSHHSGVLFIRRIR